MSCRLHSNMMIFLALAGIHVALLGWLCIANSPTRNEVGHVPAGVAYITTGQFHLYRVNPPLTRLIQAAPVWLAGADTSSLQDISDDARERPEWDVARRFANDNAADYIILMALARLPGIVWSVIGMWLAGHWAGQLYGSKAAILAQFLWCFDPNILAHASLATPDLPCAVLCLAASHSFHRYLCGPSAATAFVAGGLLGLAQLSKFTALTDYLAWGLLLCLAPLSRSLDAYHKLPFRLKGVQILLIWVTSLLVINLGYVCEGTFAPLGKFDFVSKALTASDRTNAFRDTWMSEVHVPLPANYLRGLDMQQVDFENGPRSYMRGELRQGGWWYFYIYAMLVKVPIGTLILGSIGALMAFSPRFRRFDELVLWMPALLLMGIASFKTGYTMHFRYLLPGIPFALIGMSKLAELHGRWWRGLVWLIATCSVASSLSVYPHSLSYFNELVGGPVNGDRHLIDSNIDWGQDLLRFKAWYDAHPEAHPMHLAYTNFMDYQVSGLPNMRTIPTNPSDLQPGYYAMDIHAQYEGDQGCFRSLTPVARIGYSIRVYKLDAADISQLQAVPE